MSANPSKGRAAGSVDCPICERPYVHVEAVTWQAADGTQAARLDGVTPDEASFGSLPRRTDSDSEIVSLHFRCEGGCAFTREFARWKAQMFSQVIVERTAPTLTETEEKGDRPTGLPAVTQARLFELLLEEIDRLTALCGDWALLRKAPPHCENCSCFVHAGKGAGDKAGGE
jgi:hypothetical protein